MCVCACVYREGGRFGRSRTSSLKVSLCETLVMKNSLKNGIIEKLSRLAKLRKYLIESHKICLLKRTKEL